MFGLNPCFGPSQKELFQTLVLETPYHEENCNSLRYGLQASFRSIISPLRGGQRSGASLFNGFVRHNPLLPKTVLEIARFLFKILYMAHEAMV